MAVKAKIAHITTRTGLPRMSYEEFLDWSDEDTLAEWVDGKVEIMSPASAEHQDLSGFLTAMLRWYAQERGGKVLAAPFQMRLDTVRRGREPDVIFLLPDSLPHLRPNYLDGPADLAIEIISPESIVRDRGAKYGEYEAGGVREYWVLDPATHRADFFVLDTEDRYQRTVPDGGGQYQSVVLPEFWISVDWLWQTPLPRLRDVLQAWEAKK